MTRPTDAQRLRFLTDALAFAIFVTVQYGDRPDVMERLLRSVNIMREVCADLQARISADARGES